MHIAILGTGKMGSAMGRRLAAAGHHVRFGSRDPDAARTRLSDITGATVHSCREALTGTELVIVAVPWSAAVDLLTGLAPALKGKVVVDITNPLSADVSHLVVGGDDSAGEQVARALPEARVVKAFNGIAADNFPNPLFSGRIAQVMYCSDDEGAGAAARRLIDDCGYEPQDCGALSNARYLEAISMLWLQLAFWEDRGTGFAFRIDHA